MGDIVFYLSSSQQAYSLFTIKYKNFKFGM